jgi:hypothetical protein
MCDPRSCFVKFSLIDKFKDIVFELLQVAITAFGEIDSNSLNCEYSGPILDHTFEPRSDVAAGP